VEGLSLDSLAARLPFARERVGQAVKDLVAEGFLEYRKDGEELGLKGRA
jgi:DNA-binding IclR family transcriptional regulator